MERLTRFCRALARHPFALDLALALGILLINLLVPGGRHVGERIELNATVVVLAVAGAVATTFRRRAPFTVLAVTTAVATTFVIAEQAKSPIVLYMGVAVFTVVLSKERLPRCVAVIATALATLTAEVFFVGGDVLDNLGLVFFVLFSGAIGEAVRNRRAYLHELEERALRAERSRDEEAQRRVIEERLRIAHELHDVIAHHIALMNVQSGVAAHVLRTQPDEAERALSLVRVRWSHRAPGAHSSPRCTASLGLTASHRAYSVAARGGRSHPHLHLGRRQGRVDATCVAGRAPGRHRTHGVPHRPGVPHQRPQTRPRRGGRGSAGPPLQRAGDHHRQRTGATGSTCWAGAGLGFHPLPRWTWTGGNAGAGECGRWGAAGGACGWWWVRGASRVASGDGRCG